MGVVIILCCWMLEAAADEASYQLQVSSHLKRDRQPFPVDLQMRQTRVSMILAFTIDRDGGLLDASVKSGTGSARADEEMLQWLRSRQPFPRTPDDLSSPHSLSVELVFVPPAAMGVKQITLSTSGAASNAESTFRKLVTAFLIRHPGPGLTEQKEWHAVATLSLDRDGMLVDTQVDVSSGSGDQDNELRAWLRSLQPFPRLPDSLPAPLKLTADISVKPSSQPGDALVSQAIQHAVADDKVKRALRNICKGC